MKIKVTPVLTQTEHAMWIDLVAKLRNICCSMRCPSTINCSNCPFDALTDHAQHLADEIDSKLRECLTEEEGK